MLHLFFLCLKDMSFRHASWILTLVYLLLSGLCFPLQAHAQNLSAGALYLKAEAQIKNKKIHSETELNKQYPSLKKHILYPYLLAPVVDDPLSFIKRYPDFPKNQLLIEQWMERQFKAESFEKLLQFHASPLILTTALSPSMLCWQEHAQLAQHPLQTSERLRELWQKRPVDPPAPCMLLFKKAFRQGALNDADSMLFIQNHLIKTPARIESVFKSVLPFLSQEQAVYSTLFPMALKSPSTIFERAHTLPPSPLRSALCVIAFQQLLKKNSDLAFKTWLILQKKRLLDSTTLFLCAKECALFLAKHQKTEALLWLKKIPSEYRDITLQEWHLRLLLGQEQWSKLIPAIHALPVEHYEDPRWQYWLARAYEATKQEHLSRPLYQKLASERHFYGFLASEKMERPHSIAPEKPQPSDLLLKKISAMPWFQRFHALLNIQRSKEARFELEEAFKRLSETELLASMELLAPVLTQKGYYHWMVQLLAKHSHPHTLHWRFPLAHFPIIHHQAKKHALNPAWIFAIARQESSFRSDARSSAGAMGLMQLMPTTAKEVAHALKSPTLAQQLHHPEPNVTLGTAYLKKIHHALGQHPVLATAAYNAGPGRVRQWLPLKKIPADVWIETIPYTETREYVTRVMTFYSIYNHLLGRETHFRFSEWMSPIGPASSKAAS